MVVAMTHQHAIGTRGHPIDLFGARHVPHCRSSIVRSAVVTCVLLTSLVVSDSDKQIYATIRRVGLLSARFDG